MRSNKLDQAKLNASGFFANNHRKVFSRSELLELYTSNSSSWSFPSRFTFGSFLSWLVDAELFQQVTFKFPSITETRYAYSGYPLLGVVNNLRPRAYFSHYTALKLHGLTDQLPRTLYLNEEQRLRSNPKSRLSQKSIDFALSRPPRVSNRIAMVDDVRVCLLSGQNTGNAGVIKMRATDYLSGRQLDLKISSIERTLIDIAVRPQYSGGVHQVQSAFRLAADGVSINRLVALYKEIGYVYPYHQVIGYYLETSGSYPDSSIDLVRQLPMDHDFYLCNEVGPSRYVPEWRLYVPEGF